MVMLKERLRYGCYMKHLFLLKLLSFNFSPFKNNPWLMFSGWTFKNLILLFLNITLRKTGLMWFVVHMRTQGENTVLTWTQRHTQTDLFILFADVKGLTQSKTWLKVTTTFPWKSHILENVTSPTSFLDSISSEANKALTFAAYLNTLTFTVYLEMLPWPPLQKKKKTAEET